jgi:hypothetical protein
MDTDPPAPSQYFTILLIMFTSGLVLGLYVYYVYARHVFQDHTYKRRLWERVSGIAAIVGGIGAFLALMRIIEFPYLSTRALMYVTILTTLGLLGYLAFYLITRYPQELARYESWALKQQYMPRPRRKARVR